MMRTIIAWFWPDDFLWNWEKLKKIENKSEEILDLEKNLKSILDELNIPKSEANNAYISWLTEEWSNDFSKAVHKALNEDEIAVNNILDFIENYYEINDFIENDLEKYDYLNYNEIYVIKKFLLKKEIWELRLDIVFMWDFTIKDKILSQINIKNDSNKYFLELKSFLNLYKWLKSKIKEWWIVFES